MSMGGPGQVPRSHGTWSRSPLSHETLGKRACVMSAGAGDPETAWCPPRWLASAGQPGSEQINVLLSGPQTPGLRYPPSNNCITWVSFPPGINHVEGSPTRPRQLLASSAGERAAGAACLWVRALLPRGNCVPPKAVSVDTYITGMNISTGAGRQLDLGLR